MKNVKNFLVSRKAKAGLLLSSIAASSSAFAVDHSEAINGAVADGSANYTLIITGIITVSAAGFCVGMIVSWLRK